MRYSESVNVLKNMLLATREEAHDVVIDCFYTMQDSTDEEQLRDTISAAMGISKLTDEHLVTLLSTYEHSYW